MNRLRLPAAAMLSVAASLLLCVDMTAAAEMECPSVDSINSPVFYSGPTCSQYYRCQSGSPVLHKCPTGLHWNADRDICDYPWDAGCELGLTPNFTTPLCPPGQPPLCRTYGRSITEYVPHPGDCHWYFVCNNGVDYCIECAEGLYFDPGLERCDDNEREECKKTTTESPTTTTPTQPPTTTTPTQPPTTTTPTQPPTTTTPTQPPTTTTPTQPPTTTTPTRPPTTTPTQPPTTTTPTRPPTTTPTPPPTTTTPTQPPTTTTPTRPPTTTTPTRPPTTTTPTQPPTTTTPTQPPMTTTPTRPPTTSTTEAPTTTPTISTPPDHPHPHPHPPPGHCPGNNEPGTPDCPICICDGSKFKHPYECEWYYECEGHLPVLRHCEGGFHWNEKYQVCDYPCLAGCEDGNFNSTSPEPPVSDPPTPKPTEPPTPRPTEPPTPRPTEPPTPRPTDPPTPRPTEPPTPRPTTAEPPTTPEPLECPTATPPKCPYPDPAYSVFFPHPSSCRWFYHCSNGVAYCKICPGNLHWNPILDTCDWPDHAGCSLDGHENNAETLLPAAPCAEVAPFEAPTCPKPVTALNMLQPHPGAPDHFYICDTQGNAICKKCYQGTMYDKTLKVGGLVLIVCVKKHWPTEFLKQVDDIEETEDSLQQDGIKSHTSN
ncbi:hypothetical protein ANN_04866 [Periplaneta americana]|uniref:Chitin-binding type-2 domain-containing protein n=1 Tax=Periplaneta americana TaxID=6978 RepID=A0ABQ8T9M6_PERAM|nr:hypothetical protein ANN_04866 [Periplaneta americana]